jgi:protein-tyrosine-phosphatase
MAQAFAEKLGLKASSAGTVPSSRVNPVVVEAMRERGIDLSPRTPRILTADMISHARLVVTMGCSVEEACPRPMLAAMQKKLVDWHLDDPKGKSIEESGGSWTRLKRECERSHNKNDRRLDRTH